MLNTIKSATNSITAKLPSVQTSFASKIAKAFVLALTAIFATAQQVHAAEFITGALGQLGILIIAIGGGLGIWGIVNLLEGYGNDSATLISM